MLQAGCPIAAIVLFSLFILLTKVRRIDEERTMNPLLREMNLADLDEVMRIEQQVHIHPWTRGNFTDALKSGNICKVYEDGETVVGYTVLMPAVDEMQMLNISISAEHQRKGWGRKLLGEAGEIARGMNMRRMLLEVRHSNAAALALYRDAGFSEIGLRRGYYLADNGREDAIVMECILGASL